MKKQKVVIIIFIVVLLLILISFLGLKFYLNNTISGNVEASVHKIDTTNEILTVSYGLSENQAKDILDNPQDYREVYCIGTVDNNFGVALYDARVYSNISEGISLNNKCRAITSDKSRFIINRKDSDIAFSIIVKSKDKSDEEIIELVKKGKIYLSAKPADLPLRLKFKINFK